MTSPVELARWLIPLLREYAGKLVALAESAHGAAMTYYPTSSATRLTALPEIARLVCLHDVYHRRVAELAQYASGLVEHSPLEDETRLELSIRREEVEESLRFGKVAIDELTALVRPNKDHWGRVQQIIERSGRYKSPV